MDKTKALEVYKILSDHIKNPVIELKHANNFELLIAVILSAQCTDERVNIITEKLFTIYNTPQQFANLKPSELEKLIYSCGFFRNKAKNIIEMSKILVNDYNGKVPKNYDDLIRLPGVGRKTANVMLIAAFNTPAIPVDTHIFRVSNRLGLTNAKTVKESEKQLINLYNDKTVWGRLHHLILLFGRYTCKARSPECENCVLQNYCNYYKNRYKGK